jgi:hypothetical protein
MPARSQHVGSEAYRLTPSRVARPRKAGPAEASPRLFTAIRPFSVPGTARVMNPGVLVDETNALYRKYPDKFRELRVTAQAKR